MGQKFSQPVPYIGDTNGFLCMTLRSYDKFRILHAPREVLDAVLAIARGVTSMPGLDYKREFGIVELQLTGAPFTTNTGLENATLGKLFALKVLEEMNHLGYNLIGSSDLSRTHDQSTWFMQKSNIERPKEKFCCVAPGGTDKLILLRCDYEVHAAVKHVLEQAWTLGIKKEKTEKCLGEELVEFKLRGTPWFGQGHESTMCRILLLNIVGNLGAIGWRLYTATNLKGGTDTLYFVKDPNYRISSNDLAVLSLNRSDRVRLINFDRGAQSGVKEAIMNYYQRKEPEEKDYYGALEYKLKGSPFVASGDEAILTRQLLCRFMETLRNRGYEVVSTFDISRKVTDKSVILFRKVESAKMRFACLGLSSADHLRIINFPPETARIIRDCVIQNYLPGIEAERERDAGSVLQLDLRGPPWTQNSSYNLHARSMLIMVLKEAANLGWRLVASADVSAKYVHQENGPDYPIDVHSLFFCQMGVSSRSNSPYLFQQAPAVPPVSTALLAPGEHHPGVAGGWINPSAPPSELSITDLDVAKK